LQAAVYFFRYLKVLVGSRQGTRYHPRAYLDAGNKRELIDMAMSKGYYTMVPKVLLHSQVSMLLK
jgi:hypothetical protein